MVSSPLEGIPLRVSIDPAGKVVRRAQEKQDIDTASSPGMILRIPIAAQGSEVGGWKFNRVHNAIPNEFLPLEIPLRESFGQKAGRLFAFRVVSVVKQNTLADFSP